MGGCAFFIPVSALPIILLYNLITRDSLIKEPADEGIVRVDKESHSIDTIYGHSNKATVDISA